MLIVLDKSIDFKLDFMQMQAISDNMIGMHAQTHTHNIYI